MEGKEGRFPSGSGCALGQLDSSTSCQFILESGFTWSCLDLDSVDPGREVAMTHRSISSLDFGSVAVLGRGACLAMPANVEQPPPRRQ